MVRTEYPFSYPFSFKRVYTYKRVCTKCFCVLLTVYQSQRAARYSCSLLDIVTQYETDIMKGDITIASLCILINTRLCNP